MNDYRAKTMLADGGCGVLTIDLGALARNYRKLKETAAPASVAAVVKADAYGLGAGLVSERLYAEGCRHFFVAHFVEAVRLRPTLPVEATLLVLNGLMPGEEEHAADLGVTPVINCLEQAAAWATEAKVRGTRLKAAIQIDTGMSRLGLSEADVASLRADSLFAEAVEPILLMSHLACADTPAAPASAGQLAVMQRVAAHFPGLPVSLANSGGVFLGGDFHFALARPGIAVYGGAPVSDLANPMEPVVRIDIPVIQARTVPAGTAVGYGGTFVTTGETRLATLSGGYADGIPRHLSSRGALYYQGVRLPIAGRVSMDSLTVDASALPEGVLRLGTMVEFVGPSQSLEQVAADAGTISYEILTRLGRRYRRVYI